MTFWANVLTSTIPKSVERPHAGTGAPVASIFNPVWIKPEVVDFVAIETDSFLSTASHLTTKKRRTLWEYFPKVRRAFYCSASATSTMPTWQSHEKDIVLSFFSDHAFPLMTRFFLHRGIRLLTHIKTYTLILSIGFIQRIEQSHTFVAADTNKIHRVCRNEKEVTIWYFLDADSADDADY